MADKLCKANGCDRVAMGRGYCLMHYRRVQKHGDVNFGRAEMWARGFPARAERTQRIDLTCSGCGVNFNIQRSLAYRAGKLIRKYCTRACAVAVQTRVPMFECEQCGEVTARTKAGPNGAYNKRQRFCSRACVVAANSTGCIDKHGYRVITIEGRAMFEHRHVMEQEIGRPLFAHETVHHKNGARTDNRMENLELWSSRHGSGQRVSDKIEFAKSLLAEYGVPFTTYTQSEALSGLMACV